MKKECVSCGADISYKKSNNASKCDKCIRILTDKQRIAIINRQKNNIGKNGVLMAYKTECAICEWSLSDEEVSFVLEAKGKYMRQRGCELHHIVPVRKGGKGEFKNLILLCPNCHKKADLGIITIDELKQLTVKDKRKSIEDIRLSNSGEELIDNLF